MRNKLIGVVLGVAIALAATIWLQGGRCTPRYRLLDESDGDLRVVALQYTREAAPYTAPCLQAFLRAVGPDVRVVAICGTDEDAALARRDLQFGGREMETLVVGKPITGWCKDRFLVESGSPAALIHPFRQETGMTARTNDGLVAPAIAKAHHAGFVDCAVPVEFDAGDILPAGGKLLVSDTLWKKNGASNDFSAKLASVFDQPIVWLRDVPDHHIGMYAAPLANGKVVVGDPQMAKPFWTKALDARYGKADFSQATTIRFRNAATQLRKAGYEVVLTPLVPIGPQTFITYTNGVFERGAAYMPAYGIPQLDDLAASIFEREGLRVKPIPVQTVYRFRGTIGCLINVLSRR